MAYLSEKELADCRFKSIGKDVSVSNKASIYGAERIAIGSHVRIDDYVVLSAGNGGIVIGNYVHIACMATLIGAGAITIHNFAGISSRVSIYSSNDDYSGDFLTGPTVPVSCSNVSHSDVVIMRHSIVGSGTVILPGVVVGECSAIGALSLVTKSCNPFSVYAGTPARYIKARKAGVLRYEEDLLNDC